MASSERLVQEKVQNAVTARMAESKAIEHYQGKADAERQKLAVAQQTADDVQQEFEVWAATGIVWDMVC